MRVPQKKIMFLPGVLKNVLDSISATGAARIAIEQSWKAPNMSMSTAPARMSWQAHARTEHYLPHTFYMKSGENDTVDSRNGWEDQSNS